MITDPIQNRADESTAESASPHRSAGSLRKSKNVQPKSNQKFNVDRERIERAVREILIAVGEDPDREGLLETPARVARMYSEVFSGLHTDPRIHLKRVFTENYDEIVLVRDIEFHSNYLSLQTRHGRFCRVPSERESSRLEQTGTGRG